MAKRFALWVLLFLILFLSAPTEALQILVKYPLYPVFHADLSPAGKFLATSHKGNYVEIRSIKPPYLDGRLYSPHRSEIKKLLFLDENSLLVVRSDEIEIWERKGIANWKLSVSLKSKGPIAISSDGSLLAYSPSEEKVIIYDTRKKTQLSSIEDLPDFVKGMAFSKDSSILFLLFSEGSLFSYDTASGKLFSEIGNLKNPSLLQAGKAFIIQGRRVKIVNLGDLSTLHTIKVKDTIRKILVRDNKFLLISRKRGFFFTLKEGKYHLLRILEDIAEKKLKLTQKGILTWDDNSIKLNEKTLFGTSKIPKPSEISIAGNRLLERGKNFALVWNLSEFSPEFFFKGETYFFEKKLYLKAKGGYVCYDLEKGESHFLKTSGRIVKGNRLFIWEAPYLKWKEGEIKLSAPPRWAYLLPKERCLITESGLYDLETGEKVLSLKNKSYFISKSLKSLVILRKSGIIVYRLGSSVARNIEIEYSKAFIDESGNRLALIPPYEYGLILLDLENGEEKEIDDEEIGRVKGILFTNSELITWGESGFSVYSKEGNKIFFKRMEKIDQILKADNEKIIISRDDGTLWLYSISRKRPIIYYDLNGIAKIVVNTPKAILLGLETGEILVLSKRNLTPWFKFIFLSMRDWLVLSSGNYFNASPIGKRRIVWLKGRYIYPGRLAYEKYMNIRKLRVIWNEL